MLFTHCGTEGYSMPLIFATCAAYFANTSACTESLMIVRKM